MVGNATEIRCTFSQRRTFFKINRRIYESFLFFFLQATVLGVLAENSLPMTMAPVMINTAKALAKDKAALDRLSMDRTTASYKMTYGLGGSFLDIMQQRSFLLPLEVTLNLCFPTYIMT